jgi:hypothetical protein
VADVTPLYRACPFCGSAGVGFDPDLPGIMCDCCGATGPTVSNESCDEDADDSEVEHAAWAFWNKRGEGT